LDEATAAMDAEAEGSDQRLIEDTCKSKTSRPADEITHQPTLCRPEQIDFTCLKTTKSRNPPQRALHASRDDYSRAINLKS